MSDRAERKFHELAGAVLGELTNGMDSERPDGTLLLSFRRNAAVFTWREYIGERFLKWQHVATFEVLELSSRSIVRDLLTAWSRSVRKQLS